MGGGLSKGETGPVMDEAYLRQLIEALGGSRGVAQGGQVIPSLLGRNVINHWHIEYDPLNGLLECMVRHADYNLEICRPSPI